MVMYFCLVLLALMVPVADSAICVASDEIESTYQMYNKEIYNNVSNSISRQMRAVKAFVLDKKNNPIVFQRTLFDYNVKVKFDIPANAPCTMSKLKTDMFTEMPDDAVRLDNFPLPLPDDLPEGIEYWRFKWSDNNDVIVGVVRSPHNICSVVVWGPFNKKNEIIIEEVAYIRGDYSLRIRNMDVFYLPSRCLSENDKSI